MTTESNGLDQSKISRILGSEMDRSKWPGFGNTVANPQSNDEPCHPSRCPSCRVPFVDHVGLIGTCEKLLAVQQENVKLREALGGLIEYASSVDVDNVPWVGWLAKYINRAMEAITFCIGWLEGNPAYIYFAKDTVLVYYLNGKCVSVPVETKSKVIKLCKELGINQ